MSVSAERENVERARCVDATAHVRLAVFAPGRDEDGARAEQEDAGRVALSETSIECEERSSKKGVLKNDTFKSWHKNVYGISYVTLHDYFWWQLQTQTRLRHHRIIIL